LENEQIRNIRFVYTNGILASYGTGSMDQKKPLVGIVVWDGVSREGENFSHQNCQLFCQYFTSLLSF
jgi:hypothetical protein